MDKKIVLSIIVTAVVLLAVLFATGLLKLPGFANIKSAEQAMGAAVNISSNIGDISSTLESIDKKLG